MPKCTICKKPFEENKMCDVCYKKVCKEIDELKINSSPKIFNKNYNHVSTKTKNDPFVQRVQTKPNSDLYPVIANRKIRSTIGKIISGYGKIQGIKIPYSFFF